MRKLIIIAFLLPTVAFAQQSLTGKVVDASLDKPEPLLGANIIWLGTDIGTVTDYDGEFEIPYSPSYRKLVISYVGYISDTLDIEGPVRIEHTLKVDNELGTAIIDVKREASASILLSNPECGFGEQ